jgi:hypothetical protein
MVRKNKVPMVRKNKVPKERKNKVLDLELSGMK